MRASSSSDYTLRFRSNGVLDEGGLQEGDLLANLIGLDSIDRDCGRVLEAYRDHMERYKSELDGLKLAGWFTPNFTAATDKAAQHENVALVCLQAMYVKSVTSQFRCAVPNAGRVAQAHRSLRELKDDLSAWRKGQESFAQRVEERIRNDTAATFDLDELKEDLDDEDTLSNQRQQVIDEASKRQKSVIKLHDELEQTIGKAIDHASQQLSASSEPLTLVVKLDEQNEIEQVSKLTA
jgi:Skp family chaperone for outer membrane proteins